MAEYCTLGGTNFLSNKHENSFSPSLRGALPPPSPLLPAEPDRSNVCHQCCLGAPQKEINVQHPTGLEVVAHQRWASATLKASRMPLGTAASVTDFISFPSANVIIDCAETETETVMCGLSSSVVPFVTPSP